MNILVYLEESNGSLKRASLEAVTAARQTAGDGTVSGIVINGSDAAIQQAGAYGLNTCYTVSGDAFSQFSNQRAAAAVAEAANKSGATVVMLPANASGKDIAPRVAIKLEAGLLADCVEVSASGDAVQAVRPVYAGKARIAVKTTTPKSVLTLRPNVFTAKKGDDASVAIEALDVSVDAGDRAAVVTSVAKNEGALDVAEADIIVSGGRGLKAAEHFNLVEDLAKSLGAAVGASRAVVDAGWRPHREQVGQTGKTVSPSMYVACGISGAVQHLAGMSTSKIIVAINKDKEAPIFQMADYGIVGDVFDVLPKLTQKIGAVTGRN